MSFLLDASRPEAVILGLSKVDLLGMEEYTRVRKMYSKLNQGVHWISCWFLFVLGYLLLEFNIKKSVKYKQEQTRINKNE